MRRHAVRLIQHPPRHVKRLLVPVHVLVIEVRVLVEVHGQRERFPGARLDLIVKFLCRSCVA